MEWLRQQQLLQARQPGSYCSSVTQLRPQSMNDLQPDLNQVEWLLMKVVWWADAKTPYSSPPWKFTIVAWYSVTPIKELFLQHARMPRKHMQTCLRKDASGKRTWEVQLSRHHTVCRWAPTPLWNVLATMLFLLTIVHFQREHVPTDSTSSQCFLTSFTVSWSSDKKMRKLRKLNPSSMIGTFWIDRDRVFCMRYAYLFTWLWRRENISSQSSFLLCFLHEEVKVILSDK